MISEISNPHFVEILLLEDEPSDAYLVIMALKEGKVLAHLHHVVDGREGLDFLNRTEKYANAPRPDLIFLDLNMPRMNGCEFLTAIKADEHFKSIPVVVFDLRCRKRRSLFLSARCGQLRHQAYRHAAVY